MSLRTVRLCQLKSTWANIQQLCNVSELVKCVGQSPSSEESWSDRRIIRSANGMAAKWLITGIEVKVITMIGLNFVMNRLSGGPADASSATAL